MQISATFPDELVRQIDEAAQRLSRNRGELIRRAVECYLEDLEDLTLGMERLRDPEDPILDWKDVKHELLDPDQGQRRQEPEQAP